jgi:hypothetical protein
MSSHVFSNPGSKISSGGLRLGLAIFVFAVAFESPISKSTRQSFQEGGAGRARQVGDSVCGQWIPRCRLLCVRRDRRTRELGLLARRSSAAGYARHSAAALAPV